METLEERFPFLFNKQADYNTNSPSYYDQLAKYNKVLHILAKMIDEYDDKLDNSLENINNVLTNYTTMLDGKLAGFDDSVMLLLREWIDDGTFEMIINTEIFNHKLDTTAFNAYKEQADSVALSFSERLDEIANVKRFGAKGDGVTDDRQAFIDAINSGKPIYIPIGTYYISETIVLTSNINMFGKLPFRSWGGVATTIIKSPSDSYVFKSTKNYAHNFQNITFDGYGMEEIWNSQIISCEFINKVGLYNAAVSVIDKCVFHHCTYGIQELVDSRVTNNFFYSNDVGIYGERVYDNIISENKIEWNDIGISFGDSRYNVIRNNIFDRQTNYGIKMIGSAYNSIISNQFERNMNRHIYLDNVNIVTISNNTMYAKNTMDEGSGTDLPIYAMHLGESNSLLISTNAITTPPGGAIYDSPLTYNGSIMSDKNTLNGFYRSISTQNRDIYTNILKISANTTTKNGVTMTINDDQTVSVVGVPTTDTYFSEIGSYFQRTGVKYSINSLGDDSEISSARCYFTGVNGSESWQTKSSYLATMDTRVDIGVVVLAGQPVSKIFYPQVIIGSRIPDKETFVGYTGNSGHINKDFVEFRNWVEEQLTTLGGTP